MSTLVNSLQKKEPYHSLEPIIKEVAEEQDLDYVSFPTENLFLLSNGDSLHFIHRYTFPINNASAAAVCKDKAATSDVLGNIPQIKHQIFFNPSLGDWTPLQGTFGDIHQYAKPFDYKVVCKPKDQCDGTDVTLVDSARTLEQTALKIFRKARDLVICPFQSFKEEYRALVYKKSVWVILKKNLPVVVGNGRDTLMTLISQFASSLEEKERQQFTKEIKPGKLFSQEVPSQGEEIQLHWKHNSPGATTSIIYSKNHQNLSRPTPLITKIESLALEATNTLGISFASVDMAYFETEENSLRIIEVNSASRLYHRGDNDPQLSQEVEKKIYSLIISDLFKERDKASLLSESSPESPTIEPLIVPPRRVHQLSYTLAEIAADRQWVYQSHSQGWITSLKSGEKTRLVYGYLFPINPASSVKISQNKVMTSVVLAHKKVPQIKHYRLSFSSSPEAATPHEELENFAQRNGDDVVLKPIDGTGGNGVEHPKNKMERAFALNNLLKTASECAMCAFKKIAHEYRFIMLDGEAEVIFKKTPPSVVGDGKSTLQSLIANFLTKLDNPKKVEGLTNHIDAQLLLSQQVLDKGEVVVLHWKHNLGLGATATLIGGTSCENTTCSNTDREKINKMLPIARQTLKALGMRFCSLDIVELTKQENKPYRVLEVNAGVMMENLMQQHGERGKKIAYNVYSKALIKSFSEEV